MLPNEWLNYAPKPRPVNPGEWNVFLSYRSVNRTWVLNLYDILTDLGYSVFMDQYQLAGGDKLIPRLTNGLRRSQAGILIWSHAAADSAWVQEEYLRLETKAIEEKTFFFVPIRLDNTDLPEFADSRIFLDFSSYPDGPNGGELLRLLYGISGKPLDGPAVKFANQQDEAAKADIVEINAALKIGDPEDIISLGARDTLSWKTIPALGCKAAESLIKLGRYDDALTILRQTEDRFPKAIRPKQLHALALARIGARSEDKAQRMDYLKQAQRILARLYEQGERDPETLGIFGRTWMDRYNLSGDVSDLEQSRDYYAEAFEKAPDDYYTGINAATKSVFLGTPADLEKAALFAQDTLKIVGEQAWPGDYWKTATVAELLLINRAYQKAGDMYAAAIRMESQSVENHKTSYTQAVKLLDKLGASKEERGLVLGPFKRG